MRMRRACLVAVALVGCHSTPAPTYLSNWSPTPHQPASPACVREAKARARELVEHYVDDPSSVWRVVHGKPEFGEPATLNEETFTAFLPTREGRDWLCGQRGLCASVYYAMLNRCEAARASNEGLAASR